jgi:SEC-C motif
MTDFEDLTRGVREALASPPEEERALLELALGWGDLPEAEVRIAAHLRVFVLTWDPLDWLQDRGSAWATATGDGDAYELVLYLLRDAICASGEPIEAIGGVARRALRHAVRLELLLVSGAYAQLAYEGRVQGLLAGHAGADRDSMDLGPTAEAAVVIRSDGWDPIGLGAIQDLVQEAFGAVELERSLVQLAELPESSPSCPACGGRRFGFPGELEEQRPSMCRSHRAEALAVTAARIDRARRSNPAGWRALGWASSRLDDLPPVPGATPPVPTRRGTAPGRNDPCPCGSGRKYKRCCGA